MTDFVAFLVAVVVGATLLFCDVPTSVALSVQLFTQITVSYLAIEVVDACYDTWRAVGRWFTRRRAARAQRLPRAVARTRR